MNYTLSEILNLIFRWTHVFAAIMWVGATYYFTWLDRRFHTTDPDEVWMVHSGGFYVVRKQSQPSAAHTLHWFKWEAAITWLSGIPLLILVYYVGGAIIETGQNKAAAIGIGVGVLIGGWIVYNLLWNSPLPEMVKLLISFAALVALGWWLPQVMSARAAYLHVGALLGTAMAANVWDVILPAQRKMVAAVRAGNPPDARLADRAKTRSKHNTYMVIPTVAIMISNHAPVNTYSHEYSWLILAAILVVGGLVAHIIRKQ
ncbi:MAG TPA: urate hydroxylase PuuD [Thermoanaerobaculia bacterium]|jgi:uncharacterized membrane protein